MLLLVWWCCSWSAGVLGRANPPPVMFLYLPLFHGGLTPLSMRLMSELACLARLAWDIFLGALVISSNGLMIIYSGIVFYCHLVITPLCVSI
jgi:hypothetical protein